MNILKGEIESWQEWIESLHKDPQRVWEQVVSDPIQKRNPSAQRVETSPNPEALPVMGMALDKQQARAAAHLDGPLRVMAPAGSGKTRTLTARITNLVGMGIIPGSILGLAFNRKAAGEMSERLETLGISGVRIQTFHSLGYEIVHESLGWRYSETHDSRMQSGILKWAAGMLGREDMLLEHILPVFEGLQRAKADLSRPEEMVQPIGFGSLPLFPLFLQLLRFQLEEKLLTFDDMIYFSLCLLWKYRRVRRSWQSKYKYLLVDEFQDLNNTQMLLLKTIALPENNLFVVGDDDQLIYGWRGASVEHILNFKHNFPDARSVILDTNYRSAKNIVRHANWLIRHNTERVEKRIRARPGAPRGVLEIILGDDLEELAVQGAGWVMRLHKSRGLPWHSFGILLRTNQEAQPVETALKSAGIPYDLATEEVNNNPVRHGLTLITIHKAKGKEFPYAVYFNMRKGSSGTSLEEERRVAYVGTTRAMEGLLVTAIREHAGGFVEELAYNPKFEDLDLLYLERVYRKKYRRLLWSIPSNGFMGKLKSLLKIPRPGSGQGLYVPYLESSNVKIRKLAGEIDSLDEEIHFRYVLNWQRQSDYNVQRRGQKPGV